MTPRPTSAGPESWADLARAWTALASDWAQWWMQAAAGAFAPAAAPPPASLAVASIVDPRERAALDARYAARYEALWNAAQAALAAPGTPLADVVATPEGDGRFAGRAWRELPFFSLARQSYLLAGTYLTELAGLARLPEKEKKRLAFATRQWVDALAPTNHPATNPEVAARALETDGRSLARGMENLAADLRRGRISMSDESAFALGRNLAVTPGHVVFRNRLIELIQYAPATARVHRRPLVVVPPCINKYYILDLQPANSFVRYAVAQGHTVFVVSWRNVPPELGRLAWDDYLAEGVLTAIRVAKDVAGSATVNALGFCVGGTLLACALAVLAARRDACVGSATFLTTMLDFSDPGEIGVFVSRELLAAREAALMAGERIRGSELAGAFASLRANDLVWNYVVRNYLKGETPPAFDLLHWNGDSANLPGPMYVDYLRNMYLDNRLVVPGALTMLGEPVDLGRVAAPAYVYASRDDHIVPWRSAYRTTALLGGETTFALGASGHIAGVINPPEAGRRHHWINERPADDPDAWLEGAERRPGSWWPHWAAWLARHGGALRAAPREPGSAAYLPLGPAPGRYVQEPADPPPDASAPAVPRRTARAEPAPH